MLKITTAFTDREAAWLAAFRFDTADQQAWWDALTDDDRRRMRTASAFEKPETPADAAVAARILEYRARFVLALPRAAVWIGTAALLLLGSAFILTDQAGNAATLFLMIVLQIPLGLRTRRERWERIDELRTIARTPTTRSVAEVA